MVARTCLSTGHQVALLEDDGDGVLLHRRGFAVPCQRDVVLDDLTQIHVIKLQIGKIRKAMNLTVSLWINSTS